MADWAELFDERLNVQAPVADEQIAAVPAKRGVVLLTARDDEPIVMLTAADMRSRTRTRLAERSDDDLLLPRKSPDLRQITRHVYYRRSESHFETEWQFLELAHAVWPKRYAKMISWKSPWFVHIDIDDASPYFQRTREVFARPGRYLGPFASARDAEGFIEALQDSFNLCRSIACLRRAPHGPRCAYAEMGRCASPADGTISMGDYRGILRQAYAFAAGRREDHRAEVTQRMTEAARALQFEQASSWKSRLGRLETFEQPCYTHVRPAEAFGYLLAHRGAGLREVRTFLVWRSQISYAGALAFPLQAKQLQAMLERMRALSAETPTCDDHGRLRMGLVTRSLFASPERRGLVLPWQGEWIPKTLAEEIEAHRDLLGLSQVVGREATPKKTESQTTPKKNNSN